MSKVNLIKFAKSVKKKIKKNTPSYVSYCRRIEKIKTDKRICAMTFDDGPTYSSDITKSLVETLNQFDAKGTFDVIGTTENNYPDVEGKIGTPSWSGTQYDHYPKFNSDKNAGAVNCPDLIELILSSGHEITNHTYSHILFGKKNIIYSKRHTFNSFDEVYEDVNKLHTHISEKYGYEIKLSRPPHYVDKIKGGFSSYDVYSQLGYNYLAASFDGAGWLPCESEEAEIEAMTAPLKKALEENPDALCGQIIFQKDGYNMALRAPVKEGLKRQLALLGEYGYKVVTVSELLQESPFADVGRDDKDFDIFCKLQKKLPIAFTDNTLRPDMLVTKGELAMLIAPKEVSVGKRIEYIKNNAALIGRIKPSLPYSSAIQWMADNGYLSDINGDLTFEDIKRCKEFFEISVLNDKKLTRRNILLSYKNIF